MEEMRHTWERVSDTRFWFLDRWNLWKRTVPHKDLCDLLGQKFLPSWSPFPFPNSLSLSLSKIWKFPILFLGSSNHGMKSKTYPQYKIAIITNPKPRKRGQILIFFLNFQQNTRNSKHYRIANIFSGIEFRNTTQQQLNIYEQVSRI